MHYSDKTRYWLWLSLALCSCSKRFWDVLEDYSFNAEKFYNAYTYDTVPSLNAHDAEALSHVKLASAERMLDDCDKRGYTIICYDDECYPSRLASICNPPFVLFCRGDVSLMQYENMLAIVGTRSPSQYSIDVTKKLCTDLVAADYVIVSGFALGIDSIAHRTALQQRGKTIAVLGCGLDYPYPKENVNGKEVFARLGLLISEYPPDTKPDRWCFPQRNRILSGLCNGTLVIEGGETSGSLVTATYTLEQSRDVFVVPPHDILSDKFKGNTKLLKSGAIPVTEVQDIIDALSLSFISSIEVKPTRKRKKSAKTPDLQPQDPPTAPPLQETQKTAEPEQTADADTANDDNEPDFVGFSDEEVLVLRLLNQQDMLVDELAVHTGFSFSKLFLLLTELEISGAVEARPGNVYTLCR